MPITNDALERAKLEYIPRGLTAGTSYDGYYPSVNLTYNVLPDLALRFSYAKTLGRPNFANVIPNVDIDENETGGGTPGTIRARNKDLKPWTSNNFEVSAEYYFKSGGVVSAGVFRKNVENAFGSRTVQLTKELLAEFNLEPIYENWDLVSTFNIGSATRIDGIELNFQQQLTFLPSWAKGLSAFGNLTVLDVDGSAFVSLQTKTANWGFSYSRDRIGFGFNWNYLGEFSTSSSGIGAGGVTLNKPQLSIDMNSEYRFHRRLTLFFNARNLTNAIVKQERLSPLTPEYSHPRVYTDRGVKLSAGIKATF